MEIRQFHSWFGWVSLVSYFSGILTGFLLISRLRLPSLAFIVAYFVKYSVEIVWFSVVLFLNSKPNSEFESQGDSIPTSLYWKDLKFPFSVFMTSLGNLLIQNISNQILYVFALSLPNQTRSLSINGAYLNIISVCKNPNCSRVYRLWLRGVRTHPDFSLHRTESPLPGGPDCQEVPFLHHLLWTVLVGLHAPIQELLAGSLLWK